MAKDAVSRQKTWTAMALISAPVQLEWLQPLIALAVSSSIFVPPSPLRLSSYVQYAGNLAVMTFGPGFRPHGGFFASV